MAAKASQPVKEQNKEQAAAHNTLAYDIYSDDAYDGDLVIAGEVVPIPVLIGAHRRARDGGADRSDAKPIHTPAGRLPNGRNY